MNPTDQKIFQQWLEKAEHDLMVVSMIIDLNPLILDIACFHCQQATEKFLKAFLLYKEQELIKTHNLDLLIKSCSDLDADFLHINIKDLDYYAVTARYPHQYQAPELAEVKEYYQIAVGVKNLVLSKIHFS